jgi:large subunit ribosomal protein L25
MVTVLKTEPRTAVGTRSARKLRVEGKIPAALGRDGDQPQLNLIIDADEFLVTRRKHEHVYELDVGGKRQPALVRELHWDPMGEHILHVEFRRVDLTKKTQVEVELEFTGHPKGVLNHLVTRIPVMALPHEIPDFIEVSVADLEIGTTIVASQLKLPQGVDLAAPGDLLLARISQIKIEVVAPPTPTPEEAAAAAAAAALAAPTAEGAVPAKGAPPAKGEAGKKGAPPEAAPKKGEAPRKEKG